MKSIAFTLLRDKLVQKQKKQTYRLLFIPNFYPGEIIKIVFKHKGENGKTKKREELYQAKITEIYPKQLKDITLEEAQRDGFNSIRELQKGVMKLNNIKDLHHWGFIIRWTPLCTIQSFTQKNQ